MSGILDNVRCDCIQEDKRNSIAAAVAGALFFSGWWIIIDVAAQGPSSNEFQGSYYVCGVFGTISLFMINSVSNGQLRGDSFTEGCAGPRSARLWLFTGLVIGFASLIAAGWILFAGYAVFDPSRHAGSLYGVAVFLQNLFIFGSSLVYKFGRSEDHWG